MQHVELCTATLVVGTGEQRAVREIDIYLPKK